MTPASDAGYIGSALFQTGSANSQSKPGSDDAGCSLRHEWLAFSSATGLIDNIKTGKSLIHLSPAQRLDYGMVASNARQVFELVKVLVLVFHVTAEALDELYCEGNFDTDNLIEKFPGLQYTAQLQSVINTGGIPQ